MPISTLIPDVRLWVPKKDLSNVICPMSQSQRLKSKPQKSSMSLLRRPSCRCTEHLREPTDLTDYFPNLNFINKGIQIFIVVEL